MTRVEPKEKLEQREAQQRREEAPKLDRTPGKAEGDESTVDEALRRQDEQRQSD